MSKKAGSDTPPHAQTFEALYPADNAKYSIGASAAFSNPMNANTSVVELCPDTDCFVSIGPAKNTGLTVSNGAYLPAKVVRRFACNPSDIISFIGTSGSLYVTEGA